MRDLERSNYGHAWRNGLLSGGREEQLQRRGRRERHLLQIARDMADEDRIDDRLENEEHDKDRNWYVEQTRVHHL